MKIGFVVLAGMMALEASATLNLDVGGCRVQKKIQRDELECPCSGGSGDYDWHFKELPEDWKAQNGRIFSQKGKFDNRKVFGAKVELFDKKTKESVKKSLFFNFENGNLGKVLDEDFDFDVKNIINKENAANRNYKQLWGKVEGRGQFDRITKFFDGADGIGGGCGLHFLRPFFGPKGFYRDDNNPYLNNLPTQNTIEIAIQSGKSADIRQLVINAVQSKSECRLIAKFLEKVFLSYRKKIAVQKDEVETNRKVLKSTQEQITFIEGELEKATKNQANVKQYIALLQDLRNQSTQITQDRNKLQTSLKQANQQIEFFQIEITKYLEIAKRIKQFDNGRTQKIQYIDQQIAELEARANKLKEQKAAILKQAEGQQQKLAQANKKVEENKVKLQAIRITINDLKAKIKQLNQNYDSIQIKISTTDKNLKAAGGEQNIQNLRTKLAYYKERLQQFKSSLQKIQPIYTDYTTNYDDIVKIKDSQFNTCYKNLFNDNDNGFEDDEDGVRFNGKDSLDRYIRKIYGKELRRDWSQTIINIQEQSQRRFVSIRNDVWKLLPQTQIGAFNPNFNFPDIKDFNERNFKDSNYGNQSNEDRIRMKRTHIFSPDWTKIHGSPYDDNFDENRGRRFADQDYECDINGLVNTNAFSGKVVSINKNVAKVINDEGEVCTLYLGGCTRIETVNRPIPQAGDYVYWKGKQKKTKQFQTLQMTCV